MIKNVFFILFSFVLVAFSNSLANTTSSYQPVWLKIDEAVQLVEKGEYGEAVYLFRKILEENSANPEAEMWLGFIFEKENEYDLAINYLERAYEHRRQLKIPEDQYTVLYSLSEIYYKKKDLNKYKTYLELIITNSNESISNENLTKSMLNVLKNRGFDKFIELYRPEMRISLKAYSLLGRYYYETKEWDLAVEYLMEVTGSVITRSIEELKRIDPYFTFLIEGNTDKSLTNVLNEVENNERLREYLLINSFYENMYYLGVSLIKTGNQESGKYILNKIYLLPQSGEWGALSKPWLDF